MNLVFSNTKIPYPFPKKSIFLAGPTPRDKETKSWRPEALTYLKKCGYTGTVFVPEWSVPFDIAKGSWDEMYLKQVEWENSALTQVEFIVFWVPRKIENMPAFTTNVEFGRFAHQKNCVYGRPNDSEKNSYLDWYYRKVNERSIFVNLGEMMVYISSL